MKANATFYIDKKPSKTITAGNAELKSLTVSGYTVKQSGSDYSVTVPYDTKSITANITLSDTSSKLLIDNASKTSASNISLNLKGLKSVYDIKVSASDQLTSKSYTLTVTKDYSKYSFVGGTILTTFNFEDNPDSAVAVTKGTTAQAEVASPGYTYSAGVNNGKAINLPGTYGLKLLDDATVLGDTYTVSYWMKPTVLKGGVDPTFCGGTFSPEKWVNLTYETPIWSNLGGYKYSEPQSLAGLYEANKWQHVALVVNSGKGTLYVNGIAVATSAYLTGIMTSSGAKAFFGVNGWDAYFEGALDEVIMWTSALSADDVAALAAGTVTCDSLTAK